MDKNEISNYYNYTLPFYKNLWYRGKGSYGIHYGLWNEETRSLRDSLVNTNRYLADKIDIKSKDKVLDAGCGVGGSAIWLAKKYNFKLLGLLLVKTKLRKLNLFRKKRALKIKLFLNLRTLPIQTLKTVSLM